MNEKSDTKVPIEIKKTKKNFNDFGADPEEQAMNGLYGALETEYEDRLHDSKKQ